MATEDKRSLSQGISIPQWMKNKISENKLDLDGNTFSPTELDDSFFYIRYPRASSEPVEKVAPTMSVKDSSNIPATAPVTSTKPDFSKHTIPCQRFLSEAVSKINNATSNPSKSNGTDDGFKGEAAACGSSVIKVAHQMVSGKFIRGCDPPKDDPDRPKGFNPALRRGSKSLPSSPLASPSTSPKSKRRVQNRYFTGAFVDDSDKYHGNWILSSLLGKRAISQSVGVITEEPESALYPAASDASIDSNKSQKYTKSILKPRPSELREMNCWSPTSM